MTATQMDMWHFTLSMAKQPQRWECMETCKHSREHVDYFPGTDRERCRYGLYQCGTTGQDSYQELDLRGVVHFFCKFYERREHDHTE